MGGWPMGWVEERTGQGPERPDLNGTGQAASPRFESGKQRDWTETLGQVLPFWG